MLNFTLHFLCFLFKIYKFAECTSPAIGVSDADQIPDSQITASSEGMWFPFKTFKSHFARLNGSSSWVAGVLDTAPYLQVNLAPRSRLITALATQASPEHDWWTTSYCLKYSIDGIEWMEYEVDNFTEVY